MNNKNVLIAIISCLILMGTPGFTKAIALPGLGDVQKLLDSFGLPGIDQLDEVTGQLEEIFKFMDEQTNFLKESFNEVSDKIQMTQWLKDLNFPGDVAKYIGFPFEAVKGIGDVGVKQIANLPTDLFDFGKRILQFVKDPNKALDLARRWLMLLQELALMQKSVHLCHGGCDVDILLREIGVSQPLESGLQIVKDFLEKHPKEVLFIFFEDSVDNGSTVDAIIKSSGVAPYVLKPTDWDVAKNDGWPTFGWARQNNKRLVMFTSSKDTAYDDKTQKGSRYIWLQWPFVAESLYSSIGDLNKTGGLERFKKVCMQRGESGSLGETSKRYFVLLNLFPEAPVSLEGLTEDKDIKKFFDDIKKLNESKNINSFNNLKELFEACYKYGFGTKENQTLYKPRYPNFLAIDFVNKSEPIKAINWLNEKALAAKNRNGEPPFPAVVPDHWLGDMLQAYVPTEPEQITFKTQLSKFMKEQPTSYYDCSKEDASGFVMTSIWLLNNDGTKAVLATDNKGNPLKLGDSCPDKKGPDKQEADLLASAIKKAKTETGLKNIEAVNEKIFDLDVRFDGKKYYYDVCFLLKTTNNENDLKDKPDKTEIFKWITKDSTMRPTSNNALIRRFDKWSHLK